MTYDGNAGTIELVAEGLSGDPKRTGCLRAMVPRVVNAQSVEEVTTVLHEEFVRWFGSDTAGLRQAYEAPARQIWPALLEFRQRA